jgi:hypothetical protein
VDRRRVSVRAAVLVGAGLAGALLVHLLAYHALPGLLLASGPLGPLCAPFVVVCALAALSPLLAAADLWRLRRLDRALSRRLRPIRLPGMGAPPTGAPRSPWRLAGLVGGLLGLQVAFVGLAGAACPLPPPATPALLLGPVHLLVAAALGLLLWRLERGLAHVRAAVAHKRRLLGLLIADRPRPVAPRAVAPPAAWIGVTLFARPPPSVA